MKPKGWKKDPRWVVYEEQRLARRFHRLMELRMLELQRAVDLASAQAQDKLGELHAVH